MKFIIATPGFSESSGGVIVLHYLAHLLALEGHESIIASSNTFPGSRARLKFWEMGSERDDFCDGTEMVIYPEVITDNPLKANHVTRWLLHKEGYHTHCPIEYGEKDLVFQFAPICTTINRRPDGILRVQWIRTDLFKNHQAPRSPFGIIVRKGENKKPFSLFHRKHPPGSVYLDREISKSLKLASEKFNSVWIVICYDSETWWSICAALCGCLVIIVPIKGVSRKEYFERMPFFRFGIAYGYSDIPRALLTRHKLPEVLEEENLQNLSSVKQYIDCVATYFSASNAIS